MPSLAQRFEALSVYLHKRVAVLFALRFSLACRWCWCLAPCRSGLEKQGSIAPPSALSWITLAYSIKFLWAPLVDRLPIPLLSGWLGRRRSWLLLSQSLLMLGLIGMATDPSLELNLLISFAICVAFASATQDIVVDAFASKPRQKACKPR